MATWLDFVFFTLRFIDFVILKTITEIYVYGYFIFALFLFVIFIFTLCPALYTATAANSSPWNK